MIPENSKIQNRNHGQYKNVVDIRGTRNRSRGDSASAFDGVARLAAAIVNNAFIQYAHLASEKKGKPKTLKSIQKRKNEKKDIELFFQEFNAPSIAYLESIGHEMNKDLCLQKLKEIGKFYGRKRRVSK